MYFILYIFENSILKQWQAIVKKKGGNVGQICQTWAAITWSDRPSFRSDLRVGIPWPSI